MKTFTITYAATGGVNIEAETKDEAIDIFNSMCEEDNTLVDDLATNGIDITYIFETE